jgi:hypothetical protein
MRVQEIVDVKTTGYFSQERDRCLGDTRDWESRHQSSAARKDQSSVLKGEDSTATLGVDSVAVIYSALSSQPS